MERLNEREGVVGKKKPKKVKDIGTAGGDNTWRNLLHPAPSYTVLAVTLSLSANYFM